MAQSLKNLHPKRWDIPVLVVLSLAALSVSLYLPFIRVDKLIFFKDEYTLPHSIAVMWSSRNYFLAIVILLFSILFPYAKLVTLGVVWFWRMEEQDRDKALHWLAVLGKWSMLDVFVVALVIVLTQSKGGVEARPRPGIYVFAGAIMVSMVVTMMIQRIAGSIHKCS
ncbi:MAG: hypothetical protein GC164_08085 [Phycisphaera sp.]|nr:hypothetical protein [Phycisphaera sp.]